MQSYSMFVAKKGRPKSQEKPVYMPVQKQEDTDVVQILFLLKKVNAHQFNSAKIYQILCTKYYSSIEAPNYAMSSLTATPTGGHKARNTSLPDDQVIFKHWLAIKSILNRICSDCESILYKVIIEGKMKYELLNPTNITKNNLQILQSGLDAIHKYSLLNSYIMELVK